MKNMQIQALLVIENQLLDIVSLLWLTSPYGKQEANCSCENKYKSRALQYGCMALATCELIYD